MSNTRVLCPKNDDSKSDYITDLIECKSLLTSPMLYSQTSPFVFPKKALLRILKSWHRKGYFLDLYSVNSKKPACSLELNDKLNLKFPGSDEKPLNKTIVIKSKNPGDSLVLKFEIENVENRNIVEECLRKIFNEKDDDFFCSFKGIFKKDSSSAQEIKSLSNIKYESTSAIQNEINSISNDKSIHQEIIKEPKVNVDFNAKNDLVNVYSCSSKSFYSNTKPSVIPVGENDLINSNKTTQSVIDNLNALMNKPSPASTRSPIAIKRPPLANIAPGSPNTIKRKREDTENNFITKKSNINSKTYDDYENQENKPSKNNFHVNIWNRNNSMDSKQCGKGFSNLGNTCYMNAILQCLLNIDAFSNELKLAASKQIELLNNDQNENVNGSEIIKLDLSKSLYKCLCDLLKARDDLDETLQVKSLKEIKNAISIEATRFSGYLQHDAHEFLCQILDQLKNDIDKLNKTLATTISNPVVDNFQFEVKHTIHCQKCHNELSKREEYNNLCLEMPTITRLKDQLSLQDTLNIFFRDEHIDDFKCEKCNTIEKVTIKRKFAKLPRILILHLKRYQFRETKESPFEDFKLIKNDSDIIIPRYLSLNPLTISNNNNNTEILIKPNKKLSNKKHQKKNSAENKLNLILGKSLNEQNLNSYKIPKLSKNDGIMDNVKECDNDLENENNNNELSPDEDQDQKNLISQFENTKVETTVVVNNNETNAMYVDGHSSYTEDIQEDNSQDEDYVPVKTDKKCQNPASYNGKKKLLNKDTILLTHSKTNSKTKSIKEQQTNDVYSLVDEDEKKEEEDEDYKKALQASIETNNQEKELKEALAQIEEAELRELEEIEKKKKLEDEKIEDPFIIEEEEVTATPKPKDETNGTEPNAYRIIGIVNHLGLSSNSGHYTSDVLNLKTNEWSSFDDSRVKVLSEENVLTKCSNTGYIFFYINNSFASSSLK